MIALLTERISPYMAKRTSTTWFFFFFLAYDTIISYLLYQSDVLLLLQNVAMQCSKGLQSGWRNLGAIAER
jgi:hypothetical protein